MYDVIVIGGGASGMMAAGRAAERGKKVLILEKNPALGQKLAITGGGRCNITNAEESIHLLLAHYGTAKGFLHAPFIQFGVKDTFEFFESHGLKLKIEDNKRAFPVTERAPDVVKILVDYLKHGRVEVITNAPVTKINFTDGIIRNVIAQNKEWSARSFIFATGGASHPETGSTGDGFAWLKNLGHTVETPTPNLVPLAIAETWIKDLSGVALDNVKITFFVDQTKKFFLKGKILCTHFGISGPLILNAARRVADLLHEGPVTAAIDLHPTLDVGALDRHITAVFDEHKNKTFANVLPFLVPPGTARSLARLVTFIDPETKVHSVKKEQRKMLAELFKKLPLTVQGLMGYERAVVADGGVVLKEIDNKTMRSKIISNLYVTGDLLHINRPSGGYSLQLCWTTGYVAGNSID